MSCSQRAHAWLLCPPARRAVPCIARMHGTRTRVGICMYSCSHSKPCTQRGMSRYACRTADSNVSMAQVRILSTLPRSYSSSAFAITAKVRFSSPRSLVSQRVPCSQCILVFQQIQWIHNCIASFLAILRRISLRRHDLRPSRPCILLVELSMDSQARMPAIARSVRSGYAIFNALRRPRRERALHTSGGCPSTGCGHTRARSGPFIELPPPRATSACSIGRSVSGRRCGCGEDLYLCGRLRDDHRVAPDAILASRCPKVALRIPSCICAPMRDRRTRYQVPPPGCALLADAAT